MKTSRIVSILKHCFIRVYIIMSTKKLIFSVEPQTLVTYRAILWRVRRCLNKKMNLIFFLCTLWVKTHFVWFLPKLTELRLANYQKGMIKRLMFLLVFIFCVCSHEYWWMSECEHMPFCLFRFNVIWCIKSRQKMSNFQKMKCTECNFQEFQNYKKKTIYVFFIPITLHTHAHARTN